MVKYDDETQRLAKTLITEAEANAMMKCINYQNMNDASIYKPYLNGWTATDADEIKTLNSLVEKGYATCGKPIKNTDLKTYSLTLDGLNVLSAYLKVYIYATGASLPNREWVEDDILELMQGAAKQYGASEASAERIADAARLPKELTVKGLRKLNEQGYVKKTGHGWILTDKGLNKN